MFWDIHGLAGLDRDISDYQGFFDRHGYYAIIIIFIRTLSKSSIKIIKKG